MSAPHYSPHGAVVWRGPSLVDGAPLVVLVMGLQREERTLWVFDERRPRFTHAVTADRLWDSVQRGRYETREPFALGRYEYMLGPRRAALPSAVWAALDG